MKTQVIYSRPTPSAPFRGMTASSRLRRGAQRLGWVIGAAAGFLFSSAAQEPVDPNSETKKAQAIQDDLRAIGLALHNYHDVHRSFPPAYLVDADQQPTVSWRVLILPFLGEQALYAQFDLEKPWDDPVNLPLLKQMPDLYRGPSPARSPIYTSYAGVAGPRQLFQGGGEDLGDGIRLSAIQDGPSNTIGVGPVGRNALIPWTAPADIEIEDVPGFGLADGFDVHGESGIPMLFLDGSVRSLPATTPAALVVAFSTIAGSEVLP